MGRAIAEGVIGMLTRLRQGDVFVHGTEVRDFWLADVEFELNRETLL